MERTSRNNRRRGGSPRLRLPRPKSRNRIGIRMAQAPKMFRVPRQEKNLSRNSARSGAVMNAVLGASSWMAMTFPQCSLLTSSVRVAIPEGR